MEKPPPLPAANVPDPRPGFWAWPVILLSPILLLAGEQFLPEATEEVDYQAGRSQLALLQVRAKFAIASQSAQVGGVREQLSDLEQAIFSDEEAAALAITHGFLGLENGGQEAADLLLAKRRKSPEANASFLETVRGAILNGADKNLRESLRPRIGWFADLLGEPGNPEVVPGEEEIRNGATARMMLFGVGCLGGLFSIFAGATILLIAVTEKNQGRFKPAFYARRRPSGIFLESFAIFLASMTAGNLCGWLVHWSAQPVISLGGMVLALFWPRLRGVPGREARISLGWHRGRGWLREMGAGFVGYLGLLPLAMIGIAGTYFLILLMQRLEGMGSEGEAGAGVISEPVTHPAAGWLLGGPGAKVMVFVLAVVLAPLMEELFFRGAFYRSLRSRLGVFASGLLSGFIFAALHPQGWLAIPALTAMGFGFALIREWRDSLIAPMVSHALNNGMLIGGLMLMLG